MIGRAPGEVFSTFITPSDGEKGERTPGWSWKRRVRFGPDQCAHAGASGAWKEMVLHAAATRHEGEPAAQLSIQDLWACNKVWCRSACGPRWRKEVNEVLRQEIAEHRRHTGGAAAEQSAFARLVDRQLAGHDLGRRIRKGIHYGIQPGASLKFGYEAEEAIGHDTRMLYAGGGRSMSGYKRS
jgi:hypothetical protein